MRRKVRLTESDLHNIIKEAVKSVINEVGDTPTGNFLVNAVKGRRAAKRYYTNMNAKDRAENDRVISMADDTAWNNYENNPQLGYHNEAGYRYGFDKGVEKYNESLIRSVVRESVNRILNETPLDYDEDNFSGRYTKNPNYDDYVDDEGYLDDPNHAPNSWEDDEWIDGDKDMENDYSWERFDNKPIAKGLDDYYSVGKGAVSREIDNAIKARNRKTNFSDNEIERGKRQMKRWVNGKKNLEDFD